MANFLNKAYKQAQSVYNGGQAQARQLGNARLNVGSDPIGAMSRGVTSFFKPVQDFASAQAAKVYDNPNGLGILGATPIGLAIGAAMGGTPAAGTNYALQHPAETAKATLRGEGPGDLYARKQAQKKRQKEEALQAARTTALYSRSAGINGSVATARAANASADVVAALQQEFDAAQQQRDAESMQTLQSLLFLAGMV